MGISYTARGVAAVKAMLLAKFMLLGRALRLGEQHEHRPLIWPTLYKSLMFLILVPYFAFRALGEVFGERNLVRLFFVDRDHSSKSEASGESVDGSTKPGQLHTGSPGKPTATASGQRR